MSVDNAVRFPHKADYGTTDGLATMNSTPNADPELAAMAQVLRILEVLENGQAQHRVIDWVIVRLGLNINSSSKKLARPTEQDDKQPAGNETPVREGTVNTVAKKLGANSCRTLLVAAAAYLVLYQGKEKFTREDLVSCAKGARLWKSSYGTQTSININRMCDSDELIEKSKDVFDLSQKKVAELNQKLSE